MQHLLYLHITGCNFLIEIPDISRIPNLEELRVSRCERLVEVHDSVGFLDKLAVLSFHKCSNLISLPKSLKLRSLEELHLQHCFRLDNFPKIQCKMDLLRHFTLIDIAIKELPSFPKYFTGLYYLLIDGCKNLIHLPSSILQLQQLTYFCVRRCPKVIMLPTNVRDERQSSISDVGCSSVVFPTLTGLKLDTIYFRGKYLSSTSGDLEISGSEIVSLPAWIKTFVRLRKLRLFECNQLQEILQLPANIEEISARRCVSLKSFPQISRENQFNTSQLPSLKWIDLSDCYKMAEKIENQVKDFLLDKVCLFLMYVFVCVLVYGLY